MKILKVIHGYPGRYNAGSEIYSQTLCQGLVKLGHEVKVFTRQENAYLQEYAVSWDQDPSCPAIQLCLINKAHSRDGYQHPKVDLAFANLLETYQPDVVHIGHLNHLSTSLVTVAHQMGFPILFTLHDFWLMCPRGQFLQDTYSKEDDLYPLCPTQHNRTCAVQCYWRYFGHQQSEDDISFWTQWVKRRMDHIKDITSYVDLFIAPSQYLLNRFVKEFGLLPSQILYLDYGFDRKLLANRQRRPEKEFVFGYIGTHKQAKGLHHLIQAFAQVSSPSLLRIWGKPLEPFTSSLKAYAKSLGGSIHDRITWMGSYQNHRMIGDVFNQVDAIVVPSIWGENSPLVIHEALEAQVPIITADFGGMKEFVHHEVNGLLFEHRNPVSLKEQMERFVHNPQWAQKLGQTGYLQSEDRHIPDIETHVGQIEALYHQAIQKKGAAHDSKNRSLANHL
jgi:glycosyltransferase involved in cell wall biosynthesis